jgi:hypothetical protein
MLCCVVLGGLALFGPHGAQIYRLVRGARAARSHGRVNEPVTSPDLIYAIDAAEIVR